MKRRFPFFFFIIFLCIKSIAYSDDLMNNLIFSNIEDNDYDNLKYLIQEHKIDIHSVKTEKGDTPLQYAAYLDKPDIVKLFIASGLDMDETNAKGYTALHFAAEQGHSDVIRILLDSGANSLILNNDGLTPMHLASMFDKLASVQTFVETTKQVDIKGLSNITPLQVAAQAGKNDIVAYLISAGADPNFMADNSHGTSLHFAVHGDHPDTVQLLLQLGAKVNKTNDTGDSPFVWNGYIGNTETAQILLSAGADTSIKTKRFAYQAIHTASIRGQTSLVQYFLSQHIFTGNEISAISAIPLHYASLYGKIDTMRVLLPVTANINQQDIEGKTPLHYAVLNNQAEAVKLLLEYKPDKDLKDTDGDTALELAKKYNFQDIVLMLQA